jgi:hypothetical protein
MPDIHDLADIAKDAARPQDNGPQIRLLLCLDEGRIEELPDYEGNPDYDWTLQKAIEDHHTDHLTGNTHRGDLIKVPIALWSDTYARGLIIKQIREGSGGISELDPDFYDTKSNFSEDALACYVRHLRPKGQCPDYMSDSKKLVPNTVKERREVGLPDPKDAPNLPYLCQFCPVHVWNMTQANAAKGLYK